MNTFTEMTDTERYGEASELDANDVVTTYVHADGSRTFIVYDRNPGDTESPRDYDGNIATLINENTRTIDVDTDTAGLADARDRWQSPTHSNGYSHREAMMTRYLAMFRPDIALYVDYWTAGDSFGWGYVTREALADAGLDSDAAQSSFDAEVKVYASWAEGDIYGAVHVEKGDPIITADFTGSEITDYEWSVDAVWGFLGYEDQRDIAAHFTDSPVVGEE